MLKRFVARWRISVVYIFLFKVKSVFFFVCLFVIIIFLFNDIWYNDINQYNDINEGYFNHKNGTK